VAKILFYNGFFYTGTKPAPLFEKTAFTPLFAMLVGEGKILKMGLLPDFPEFLDPECLKVDLQRKFILPGFNDAHIHIWKVGNLKTFLQDVRGFKSFEEIGRQLYENAQKTTGPNTWILARGFNEAEWNGQIPTRQELDLYVSDQPVYLLRTCAHIAVLNSKALAMAGIDENSANPVGGKIWKDAHGNPNGILSETALALVHPYISHYTDTQYEIMLEAAMSEFLALGITSATDPAVHPELLKVYLKLSSENKLKIRVNAIPILLPDGDLAPYPLPEIYNSPYLQICTAKLFADGGLSSTTAALKRPYANRHKAEPLNFGMLRIPTNLFMELANYALDKGHRGRCH
jgi:predicted amidohydrolase YtcJ